MEPDTYQRYIGTGEVRSFRASDQFYRQIPKNFIVAKRGGYISAEAFKNTMGTLEMSVDWEALCTASQSLARKDQRAIGRFYQPVCDQTGQVPIHDPIGPPEPLNIAHCNIVGDKSQESVRQSFADATEIILSPPDWEIPVSIRGERAEGTAPADA